MLYVYRAFLSGSKLQSLGKEVNTFMSLYFLYKRHTLHICVAPFSNAIALLVGRDLPGRRNSLPDDNDDQILVKSLKVKEMTVAETVVICKMMCSLIFRDLENAEKVARQYMDFFAKQGSGSLAFITIYRQFYGGLIVSGWIVQSPEHLLFSYFIFLLLGVTFRHLTASERIKVK